MNEGTIFPATDFNPGVDAEVLASALQGMECNKDDLIEILTQRSNAQRLIIAQIYNDSYGQVWNLAFCCYLSLYFAFS
ncbi:hypothetical protein scyTo_0017254 [Scyliorhinus torazame]|uniref:Annexin n=1 Tax=Scyliorhinus torazame TaxID=75743 RepID=A0A401Q5H4_SCYTO|nr:hypothetical protein [Scyliorhinus torazame]